MLYSPAARTINSISSISSVDFIQTRSMSKKPKAYVTRRIPDPGTQILTPCCNVSFWDSDDIIPREELLKNVSGVDAILCMLTDRIDKEVLEHAGKQNIVILKYQTRLRILIKML